MKILHVLHGFPPETAGGTERSVEALARAMQQMGCTVEVLAGSLQLGDPGRVEAHDYQGLPVFRLHRDDLYFETWFKAHAPAVSRSFRTLLAERQPDVVHVHHWLRLSSDLVRVARASGCTVAVSCHDYFSVLARPVRLVGENHPTPPPSPSVVGAAEAAEAFAFHRRDFADELRAAHLRFAPSATQAEGVAALADQALGRFVIASPHLGTRLRRLPGREPRGRRLLTWGTLYPEKGIESVLAALAATPTELGWSLVVYGETHAPEFRARIEAQAQGLRVEWRGAFTPADLEGCAADYAVLPSLAHESYGLVLDEALQLGLPIIAADVPAYRERAPGGSCAFYPPGDARALASSLSRPSGLEALRRPEAPKVATIDVAAQFLVDRYRAAAAQDAVPYTPQITDEERARVLFRRAERRLWSALQQPHPPAPPDDFLAPP